MPVEDSKLAELFQASLVSFDPECSEFSFRRVIPVAVYVDAGDKSTDLESQVASLVDKALKESGFEEPQEFARFHGSLILLNLSRSSVPLDGPTFLEKLGTVKNNVVEGLKGLPWKKAGSAVKVAVAIGTVVIILSGLPAATPVIGSFAVPVRIWIALKAAREGVILLEELKNILTDSKAAKNALREAEQAIWRDIKGEDMSTGEDFQTKPPPKFRKRH
jgi:hypothetical protein